MNVTRTVDGDTVIISPVFSGGYKPRYWEVSINHRLMWRTFESPRQALLYVESMYRRRSRGLPVAGVFALFLSDV